MQKIITLDIFNEKGEFAGVKNFYNLEHCRFISEWIATHKKTDKEALLLGMMNTGRTDFANQNLVYIQNNVLDKGHSITLAPQNLMICSVFYAVRHAIEHTWINHNDQFLYPSDKWQNDTEFHSDCLAFMLFHHQNRISGTEGVNHFIPFTECEVGSKEAFESDFVVKFINGKIAPKSDKTALDLNFQNDFIPNTPIIFSLESEAVFTAGREVWRYYHARANDESYKAELNAKRNGKISFCEPYNPNAALYDIKAFFKGRKLDKDANPGAIALKSDDAHFNDLMAELSRALENLATKIAVKIYEYGFLKA